MGMIFQFAKYGTIFLSLVLCNNVISLIASAFLNFNFSKLLIPRYLFLPFNLVFQRIVIMSLVSFPDFFRVCFFGLDVLSVADVVCFWSVTDTDTQYL